MVNALIFSGIIFQIFLAAALIWCIWNEKKLIAFEHELIRRIKVFKKKRLAEKRKAAVKAAAKDLPKEVYYTPVKPVRRHTSSSFDVA